MTSEPSKRSPLDQAVRDRFVTDLERNAVVEAGAGTGKTTLIVKRIVALVLGRLPEPIPGVTDAAGVLPDAPLLPLSEVAAITFTEAAASELRERVRAAFTEARTAALDALQAAEASAEPGPAIDELLARLQQVDAAIADLDQALIATIHGFCQTILREHALSAGLDPSFEVIEANAARRLKEEVFDLWFDEMGEHPAVRRALAFGIQPSQLEERARDLLEAGPGASAAPAFHAEDPAPLIQGFLGQLKEHVALFGPHVEEVGRKKRERLYRQVVVARALLEAHGDLLGRDLDAPELQAQRSALELELMQPRFADGSTGGGRKDGGEWTQLTGLKAGEVNEHFEAFRDALAAVRGALGARLLAEVEAPLRAYRAEYEAMKARRALVDFDDLLVRAERLVREDPRVRQRLFRRVRTLFVDEFQDTDPVQARLVFAIAGGPGTEHETDWRKIVPAPGRLVLMGDPKQSIYRFRSADVETYRTCCELVVQADPQASYVITTNFRTDGSLVEFVNRVFSEGSAAMSAPPGELYQADYIGLVPHHAERGVPTSVLALAQADEDVVKGSAATLRLEAATVVAELGARLDAWGLGWGDVAILGRVHKALAPYAEVLARAGIDFIYEGRRALFEAREVVEALTVLQAIVDPGHQTAVVGALRSVWFGIDDDALMRHRLAGGGWNPLEVPGSPSDSPSDSPGEPSVQRALLRLKAWAERVDQGEALVEELFFGAGGWRSALLRLRPNGAQAVMDLQRLAGLLFEQLADQGANLVTAVRTCQLLARSGSDEGAAQLEARSAVRLMTVHKSKGLEFGVVVLAAAAGRKGTGGDDAPGLFEGELVWRLQKDVEHPLYATRRKHEAPRDEAEELRLFYVALTRAKHRLVVPLFGAQNAQAKELQSLAKRVAAGPFGKRLQTSMFEDDAAVEVLEVRAADPDAVVGADPETWAPALRAGLAEISEGRAPEDARRTALGERRTQRPVPFGPSRVAEAVHASRAFETKEPGAALPDAKTEDAGAAARELGTLVHLCIEERVAPEGARERAERAGFGPTDAAFAERCVAAELALDSHARAFAAGATVWDELPISWGGCVEGPGADLLMHAFIDRLVRHGDGSFEIVDFKTDRLEGPADELEARLAAAAEHHFVQLALYALALEAAGCEVRALTLAFLAVERDVSVSFDAPRRAAAHEALAAYRAQLV